MRRMYTHANRNVASTASSKNAAIGMGVYLDYASTTPVDKEVLKAMMPFLTTRFGNPSSLHVFGQEASGAVFKARRLLAETIGASTDDVVFTASATEANNLALKGAIIAAKMKSPRIIVSSIEHESILETARSLARDGVDVVEIPVNKQGVINVKILEAALTKNTVLVSVMHANNEVGTIEPIEKIASLVREHRKKNSASYPLLHTDAAQTLALIPINVDALGVDLMTLSSHKTYGPKGAAALYVRNRKQNLIAPSITGGGQEQGMRSGTENVAAIVGFANAAHRAQEQREEWAKKIGKLRDQLWQGLKKISPGIQLNGPVFGSERLVHNLHASFPGYRASDLLPAFDIAGLAVSAGSACASHSPKPSHVLAALGMDEQRSRASIRFTLGTPTTQADIARALTIVGNVVRRVHRNEETKVGRNERKKPKKQ